jgi:hypothetical protein
MDFPLPIPQMARFKPENIVARRHKLFFEDFPRSPSQSSDQWLSKPIEPRLSIDGSNQIVNGRIAQSFA